LLHGTLVAKPSRYECQGLYPRLGIAACAFFILLGAVSASADTITFDFNHATLPDGASNAAVQAYMHAPISGPVSKARAAQWLGVSGYIDLPGVTILEFYDWPERVGIDNLTIEQVPEPGMMLLLGTAAAGLWVRRRKRNR